jgi:hypothetical protein
MRERICAPRSEALATKSQSLTIPWGNPSEAEVEPRGPSYAMLGALHRQQNNSKTALDRKRSRLRMWESKHPLSYRL